jgi:hypothetical protein
MIDIYIVHVTQIKLSFNMIYNQTKYFFMEIINTFKQSIAKIFNGTNVFVRRKEQVYGSHYSHFSSPNVMVLSLMSLNGRYRDGKK